MKLSELFDQALVGLRSPTAPGSVQKGDPNPLHRPPTFCRWTGVGLWRR